MITLTVQVWCAILQRIILKASRIRRTVNLVIQIAFSLLWRTWQIIHVQWLSIEMNIVNHKLWISANDIITLPIKKNASCTCYKLFSNNNHCFLYKSGYPCPDKFIQEMNTFLQIIFADLAVLFAPFVAVIVAADYLSWRKSILLYSGIPGSTASQTTLRASSSFTLDDGRGAVVIIIKVTRSFDQARSSLW